MEDGNIEIREHRNYQQLKIETERSEEGMTHLRA